MSDSRYIYKLVDPRTQEIRYIGKTNNIETRYKDHIREGKKPNFPVHHWINQLYKDGYVPTIEIVETCDKSIATKREEYHIRAHRYAGHKLLNTTIARYVLVANSRRESHPANIETGIADNESQIQKPPYQLSLFYDPDDK